MDDVRALAAQHAHQGSGAGQVAGAEGPDVVDADARRLQPPRRGAGADDDGAVVTAADELDGHVGRVVARAAGGLGEDLHHPHARAPAGSSTASGCSWARSRRASSSATDAATSAHSGR